MKRSVNLYVLSILLSVIIVLGSCGESVDPTKTNVKIEMKAVSKLNSLNAGARVANSSIEFTEALVGVTEIELELKENDESNDDSNDDNDHNFSSDGKDDDSEDEIEFEGQFTVDLLKGTSDPDFGIADVIPGEYEEIEIEINPILDDGNSIFIAFTYQPDEGESIDVEFTSTGEFEIEIENDNGIILDGNSLNQLLILMDLDMLISGLDISNLEPDQDGIVRISDTSNSDINVKIQNKIDDSFEAGEDSDDDDEFDDHDDSNSDSSKDD